MSDATKVLLAVLADAAEDALNDIKRYGKQLDVCKEPYETSTQFRDRMLSSPDAKDLEVFYTSEDYPIPEKLLHRENPTKVRIYWGAGKLHKLVKRLKGYSHE